MALIEIAARPFVAIVAAIHRRARAGGSEAAADSGAHRIDREIIDRLAERVGAVDQDAGLIVALAESELRCVVVGIAAVVDHQNLVELRIGTEARGERGAFESRGEVTRGILAEIRLRRGRIDERGIQAASKLSTPREIGLLLAREKAKAVSANRPGSHVIGADQTLALGDRLFNKPAGRAQALAQLRDLAGHSHELNSAVAVAHDGRIVFEDVSVARMTMRPMSEDKLSAYLDAAGDAVTTSVGAYQLEGLGIHLFERIEGDHFTILGLPLLPLLAFLRRERLIAV